MFSYNRFWHFWYTLNNRNYSQMFGGTLILGLLLAAISFAFPMVTIPVWGITALIIAPTLIVASVTYLCTKLSDFFYNRQNQKLHALKREPKTENNKLFNDQVDLYLDRRIVCPSGLLAGELLHFPQINTPKLPKRPFTVDKDCELTVTQIDGEYRHSSYRASSETESIVIKEPAALDALSEVSAREMAELMGFEGLIPANTVTEKPEDLLLAGPVHSAALLTSRRTIAQFIDRENELREERAHEKNEEYTPIKNTPGVQSAVAKFIFNLKTSAYSMQAKAGKLSNLLYMQEKIPAAQDGAKVYADLFIGDPDEQQPFSLLFSSTVESNRVRFERAKRIIEHIDLASFQENFLLQIVLGSQDCNPGNTLFTAVDDSGKQKIYSIDHERIMPEDNYNITKSTPLQNGNHSDISERAIENVFPIRLWLAGLPQAEAPFSKDVIAKTLANLDPDRLLAYHRQKKLFSPKAVGAQLERVHLIRSLFEEEAKKDTPTLTSRELFLRLVNNHPSYCFLKHELKLSDFTTFMALGFVPENADWSLIRHPTQTWGIWASAIEAQQRAAAQKAQERVNVFNPAPIEARLFSDETFATSSAPRLIFFALAQAQKQNEQNNKPALEALEEISEAYRSNTYTG